MPTSSTPTAFVLRAKHRHDTFEVFFLRDLSIERILVFPAAAPSVGHFIAIKDCPWPIRDMIEREQEEG